jgi:hypothetical protein
VARLHRVLGLPVAQKAGVLEVDRLRQALGLLVVPKEEVCLGSVVEDPRVATEGLAVRAKARAHSVHSEVVEQMEAKVAFLE